jgi:hypothetical protein
LGLGGGILSEENTENIYTTQHDATTQYLKEFLKTVFRILSKFDVMTEL